jgi:parallel beta helix pectate lyase-like protein
MSSTIRAVSFAVCFLFGVSFVQAAQRTFVSAASGSDSNPCTRLAPCRNFAAAMNATDSGGEIVVLDSGGYGAVTISKSLSIIAPPGVYAGITGFTGAAVTVSTPSQSGTVALRGLVLNGEGANTGIDFLSGRGLHIESCRLSGFPLRGINADHSDPGVLIEVFVNDTIVLNGDKTSGSGILLNNPPGLISGVIDSSRVHQYYVGVFAMDDARVIVRNSTMARNIYGVVAQAVSPNKDAEVIIENCALVSNSTGVLAGLDNTTLHDWVSISNSLIAENSEQGIVGLTNSTCWITATIFARNNNSAFTKVGGTFDSGGGNRFFSTESDQGFDGTTVTK